ncbi:MAG: hypothetical protein CFE43_01700 [Burkholderiales bacterium PBB3]|nr:MAG: hypothetical protein CFE43_01700 [Burkholderiales bacterium PBB3]
MFTKRTALSAALSTALLATLALQPAMAQNKAAMAKATTDFQKHSTALAASLSDLTTRTGKASPNDKDMLKLITGQIALVDATADGVVALGGVAAEVKDAGDMAIAKKYLAIRCKALKTQAEGVAPYIGGLANNIAAPATATEVNKAKDLIAQLPQQALCSGK